MERLGLVGPGMAGSPRKRRGTEREGWRWLGMMRPDRRAKERLGGVRQCEAGGLRRVKARQVSEWIGRRG
jgi:hypothetical protein